MKTISDNKKDIDKIRKILNIWKGLKPLAIADAIEILMEGVDFHGDMLNDKKLLEDHIKTLRGEIPSSKR